MTSFTRRIRLMLSVFVVGFIAFIGISPATAQADTGSDGSSTTLDPSYLRPGKIGRIPCATGTSSSFANVQVVAPDTSGQFTISASVYVQGLKPGNYSYTAYKVTLNRAGTRIIHRERFSNRVQFTLTDQQSQDGLQPDQLVYTAVPDGYSNIQVVVTRAHSHRSLVTDVITIYNEPVAS